MGCGKYTLLVEVGVQVWLLTEWSSDLTYHSMLLNIYFSHWWSGDKSNYLTGLWSKIKWDFVMWCDVMLHRATGFPEMVVIVTIKGTIADSGQERMLRHHFNTFKCREELQKECKELLYVLHSDSPALNILPHLLLPHHFRLSLQIACPYFFMEVSLGLD